MKIGNGIKPTVVQPVPETLPEGDFKLAVSLDKVPSYKLKRVYGYNSQIGTGGEQPIAYIYGLGLPLQDTGTFTLEISQIAFPSAGAAVIEVTYLDSAYNLVKTDVTWTGGGSTLQSVTDVYRFVSAFIKSDAGNASGFEIRNASASPSDYIYLEAGAGSTTSYFYIGVPNDRIYLASKYGFIVGDTKEVTFKLKVRKALYVEVDGKPDYSQFLGHAPWVTLRTIPATDAVVSFDLSDFYYKLDPRTEIMVYGTSSTQTVPVEANATLLDVSIDEA